MAETMRIHRALAQAGVASRRASEALVEAGRVTVNGVVATVGQQVGPGDAVAIDGKAVQAEQLRVYVLNKKAGVVSTVSDPEGRPTVIDDMPDNVRLYPVGRLDIDTTGALLITNDGELANRLMHPRAKAPKIYEALVEGRVSAETVRRLRSGVELEDGMTLPAKAEVMDRLHPGATWLRIELTEGRNRQIKRMGIAVGHRVKKLRRVRYAGIGVQGLRPGEWRPVTRDELNRLRNVAGLGGDERHPAPTA
jgi:23S rRNA pseudouridine2605 synthase